MPTPTLRDRGGRSGRGRGRPVLEDLSDEVPPTARWDGVYEFPVHRLSGQGPTMRSTTPRSQTDGRRATQRDPGRPITCGEFALNDMTHWLAMGAGRRRTTAVGSRRRRPCPRLHAAGDLDTRCH